ncbi:MAG: energy transducer TonB [Sphingomicrobium sp.]|nr:energy transducer TonB [Sphingomonadales bacterium]
MKRSLTDRNDRLRSAALVIAIHLALGWALINSLGYKVVPRAADALKLFNLTDPPPPPAVPPPPEAAKRATHKPKDPEGAAAPPALRNTPTEVAAPKPKLVVPTPVPAAPVPGQGTAPAAGAAPVPGPGTGRGGTGNGVGSGLSGNGTGGGGGGGLASPARQIDGDINDRDYPTRAIVDHAQGTVTFAFIVGPDGRLTACRITRSSGNRALDDTTCRLALRRFRFRPATDTAGRPVASEVRGEQEWQLGPMQEQPGDEPRN